MKVEKILEKDLEREFNITVAQDKVQGYVAEKLNEYSKKVKLPGFREGKVPLDIVKKKYGKEILGEAVQAIVNATTQQVLDENKLTTATQPVINIVSFDENQPLVYNMKFEVAPQVPEVSLDKLTVKRPVAKITDKELNETLENIKKGARDYADITSDRAAKNEDLTIIDFKGFVGDEAFEGGEAKGFQLVLGSNALIPGFEDQIVGMKKGETRRIKVKFPENYHAANLKGKDAEFEINLHEIRESKPVELTDDYAKKMGFETVEKLKEAITGQLQGELDSLSRVLFKKALFDVISGDYKFQLPKSMVEAEFNGIWQQIKAMKDEHAGHNHGPEDEHDHKFLDKPEAELEKEYKTLAERRVMLGFIISDIGMKNNIQVTQEELQRAVYAEASRFPGQEQKVFEFYQKNPNYANALRGPILEEKVVDFIMGKIAIKDEVVSIEQLQKLANEQN
jgi:trigger factor